MSEVANQFPIELDQLIDMDACYETFDKDGYVSLIYSLVPYLKTFSNRIIAQLNYYILGILVPKIIVKYIM